MTTTLPPLIARADVDRLSVKYDSRLEEEWASSGPLWMSAELKRRIVVTYYHPLTFHLGGQNYTPDFLHIADDGRMVFVECKGSRKQKGYRDARAKLRVAAAQYPCFTFYEALGTISRGLIGWEPERI